MKRAKTGIGFNELGRAAHIRPNEVETVVLAHIHKGRVLRQETVARVQHRAPVADCSRYYVRNIEVPIQNRRIKLVTITSKHKKGRSFHQSPYSVHSQPTGSFNDMYAHK